MSYLEDLKEKLKPIKRKISRENSIMKCIVLMGNFHYMWTEDLVKLKLKIESILLDRASNPNKEWEDVKNTKA